MTVLQYLQNKKIKDFQSARSLMIGKKVKIRPEYKGSYYGKPGDIFPITSWSNPSDSTLSSNLSNCCMKSEFVGLTKYMILAFVDLVSIDTISELKEEISFNLAEIEKLQVINAEHQQKIDFMTENGLESFDEDEFKVFAVLKQLSNKKTSEIEKAKAIAKLIKGS